MCFLSSYANVTQFNWSISSYRDSYQHTNKQSLSLPFSLSYLLDPLLKHTVAAWTPTTHWGLMMQSRRAWHLLTLLACVLWGCSVPTDIPDLRRGGSFLEKEWLRRSEILRRGKSSRRRSWRGKRYKKSPFYFMFCLHLPHSTLSSHLLLTFCLFIAIVVWFWIHFFFFFLWI